jgi:hypothetical protein
MKAKLKLFEILNLDIELNGFSIPETGEVRVEGLIQQKLSHTLKYKLREDNKKIIDEKNSILQVQNDLILKYGNEGENGNFGLNRYIDEENKIVNPEFIKYSEEWNKFLVENEKEIELTDLTLDDLSEVTTKDAYHVIDTYFIKINE